MTHLYVKMNPRCIHCFYEDREYGSWEETWTNSLEGVHIEDNVLCEKVPVDFEVVKGDIVYVVWCEYSSGDSFGSGTRNRTEVIHIFKDKDLAWDAYRILEGPDGEGYDNWTVKFKSDSGKEMSYHRPWLGYFDSLDSIYVEEAIIE